MTTDLLARLEAATEGGRELDAAVAIRMGVAPRYEGDGIYGCPRYTTSIDAALTLVPEGMEFSLFGWPLERDGTGMWAEVITGNMGVRYAASAATPALALCIAALKAREADQ